MSFWDKVRKFVPLDVHQINQQFLGFREYFWSARLLEYLSKRPDVEAEFARLPDSVNTPELQIKLQEGESHALIRQLQQSARFDGAREVITIDGLRVEYPDGFGLARSSNTTPVIVLRFEADNPGALKRIQEEFRHALQPLKPNAPLPY